MTAFAFPFYFCAILEKGKPPMRIKQAALPLVLNIETRPVSFNFYFSMGAFFAFLYMVIQAFFWSKVT